MRECEKIFGEYYLIHNIIKIQIGSIWLRFFFKRSSTGELSL